MGCLIIASTGPIQIKNLRQKTRNQLRLIGQPGITGYPEAIPSQKSRWRKCGRYGVVRTSISSNAAQ
jgi:hypothetical protein